jgi:hypothetical protein
MVLLLPRVAAVAFAALVCWSCGSDPSSTQSDAGRESGAMGGSSADASAADNDAKGGSDASDEAVADALAEVDGASKAFTLTSSGFTNMEDINVMSGCGSTMSPPLAWTPGPSGTQSYGLVLTDPSGGDPAGGYAGVDGRRRVRCHPGQRPREREADRPGNESPL